MKDVTRIKPRKTTEQFKKEIYDLVKDEYQMTTEYLGVDIEATFYHNKCNRSFPLTPHQFKQGRRCPFCANRKVYIGVNDLNTVRPDMVKYLHNKEDKFLHYGSGKVVEWDCLDCGHIFKRSVSDMCNRGTSCPKCSDGISYPNKFMFNILLQIDDLDFLDREFRPGWCKFMLNNKKTFGKYDIYFGYKDKLYIIEMDGGLGHGNRTLSKTVEESLYIDNMKDKLANEHNIKVIRIDCNYERNDRFIFIKNNILNSDLINILDFKTVDFDKADLESLNSYIVLASKYWNDGMSVGNICKEMNLNNSTIRNYLEKCVKLGLCDYNKEKSKNRAMANKVYCLTTKENFDSIIEASRKYNIQASCISKCCRGKQSYAGFYNGEKLVWAYYDDYIKNGEDNVKCKLKENKNYTKVICITTEKIFNSINEAAEYYGIRASGIQACCCGRYKYSGVDSDTGKKLIWKYYKDYLEESVL